MLNLMRLRKNLKRKVDEMNPKETPVIRLIKKEFDRYISLVRKQRLVWSPCDFDPLEYWMYYFLFPEMWQCYKKDGPLGPWLYPCHIMSEEQVLRILAESGII